MDNQNKIKLQLKKVRKIFFANTVDQVTALTGIDLDVYDGDFISIIGSNGAGKSTVLNIVAGVFPPERGGQVLIENQDVTRLPEYRHATYVGRVWQQPSVGTAGNLTIEENLALAYLRGKPRGLRRATTKELRKKFQERLALLDLGLEDRMSALVGTLSGGQRQSLSLIMATISKPSVLLLDEHIATLDPKTAEIVLGLTDKIIRNEKMTALMVTHHMEMALKYGNRLIMMHKGRIVVDVQGEDKGKLTVKNLLAAFANAAGESLQDDKILLDEYQPQSQVVS